MSDEKQDGPEVAYPGSNPHPTPRADRLAEDHSDPIEKEVEPSFVVTPGTETTEERREIAAERRSELGFPDSGGKANGVDESGDPDDATEKSDEADGEADVHEDDDPDEDDAADEPQLTDESDDEEPKLPADDSPVHGESTIPKGSTDPTL